MSEAGTSAVESIAVVGMACRFPGASGLPGYWRLLRLGQDAITEIPKERFDAEPLYDARPGRAGKLCSRRGGFLQDVESFDAAFFGIAPRQALRMDPQHRLLLELAWEAVEDAGYTPRTGSPSRVGVFVGLGAAEYTELAARRAEDVDLYLSTGGTAGVAAGRISHVLGFQGPSLAIDSDRSASLVAVHYACQSLRAGEGSLALAGGVNLILRPTLSIAFSQAGMLSPEGRCKAFDAGADGFVRSEGAALVLLKPLREALRDGDPVYAVVRGSAVNSDGATAESLLTPSRAAQEDVLRAACRQAGISPGELDYVEAHGTGTPVGDLTETLALGAVLREGRPAGRPCRLGSVKTNIGHTEAAAGIAGLIKTVLALHQREIPASLHFSTPNPKIPWRDLCLRVQSEGGSWPSTGAPARAGVSSFGIGGTNAHVVLEAAPDEARTPELRPSPSSAAWRRRRYWIPDADSPAQRRPSEASVREIVGEVLQVDPQELPAKTKLVRLGLDSLMAMELSRRLEREAGRRVPAASLLRGTSLWDLEQDLPTEPDGAKVPESRDAGAGTLPAEAPLSYGQRALWFLYRLAPQSPVYNVPCALRVRSRLDAEALRRAAAALVARHPALRTTFRATPGGPVQRSWDVLEAEFLVRDVAEASDGELRRELRRLARLPFDLEAGPLLRVALLSRAPEDHYLFLGLHHVYSDFSSLVLLLRELEALYRREASPAAATAQLVPLRSGYGDFVAWQRETLAGPEGERLWAYWRGALGAEPPETELPIDRPRPPVQSYNGALETRRLGTGLSARLKDLARRHDATLTTLLLAAFQGLLHAYTGGRELLVGSLTTGRDKEAFADVVGYFVNPVVLASDSRGDPSFAGFLERTRETALQAFAHQDFPFPLLVERLRPERDASRSPLFQAAFTVHKARGGAKGEGNLSGLLLGLHGDRVRLGELQAELVGLDPGVSQFDLTLILAELESELVAAWQYNTDLFDATTLRRMAGHFVRWLEGAADDPGRRLSRMPLMSRPERHQLLIELNDTAEAPGWESVVEWFSWRAARSSEAPALVGRSLLGPEETTLSYGELEAAADRLAADLVRRGAGRGSLVGLCLSRSVEMAIAVVGVLKTGAAYVPLDPTYPRERLQRMVEEAGLRVLLTEEALRTDLWASLAGGATDVVSLDVEGFRAPPRSPPLPAGPSALDLAYVIYTSGSTGRPKGIALSHLALVNLVEWHLGRGRAGARLLRGARMLQIASLSFDASFHEMFATWCSGGTLILVPERMRRDAAELARFIGRSSAEKAILPVVILQRLAEHCLARGEAPGLSEIVVTGEQLQVTPAVAGLFRQLLPETTFHNHYGPSETHVVTAHSLHGGTGGWPALPPIGRPILRTEIYLLGPRGLDPVVPGTPGELCVGGVSLARGYLARPARTAERFIPDPFSKSPGQRLYRTGDLARYRDDGTIDFLGRFDHQVKIRGFRVELGEVEAALSRHPAVQEAVASVEGRGSGTTLVAYAVPSGASSLSVGEIRAFLAGKLPAFMVPTRLVLLDALPQTPSGKVDRRALPAASPERPPEVAFVAPVNDVERALAGIWRKSLGLRQVGVEDNFFDAGGHSLLLPQVCESIRQELGYEIPVADLFEYPTVRTLARHLGDGAPVPTPREATTSRETRIRSMQRQRRWREKHRRGAAPR